VDEAGALMFDLILSKSLTADQLLAIFRDQLPGMGVQILQSDEPFPDDPGEVLAQLKPTLDPAWPVALDVLFFPDPSPIGALPALRLAEAISARTGADVMTDLQGLFPELNPHDPYWWLTYCEGCWYLADSVDMPLMGPYTNGTETFPGDGVLKLVRPVNPWAIHTT
jgi:hypothetical protein